MGLEAIRVARARPMPEEQPVTGSVSDVCLGGGGEGMYLARRRRLGGGRVWC